MFGVNKKVLTIGPLLSTVLKWLGLIVRDFCRPDINARA